VTFQKQASDECEMTGANITTVLVIYSGGTIGMEKDPQHGYLPVHGYLHQYLSKHPSFHDYHFYDTLSRTTFLKLFKENSDFHPPLITPPSVHGKRVLYQIKEYECLSDSSNMNMSDWIRIAGDIESNYKQFDAFVILHGTDTMAFTSSALSFLLENLGKTVIVTGSQIPLSELRNDAVENFLGSLLIAGHYVIPEVCLFFHHRLFRGNRTTKQKALDLDAFASPNFPPIAHVGVNIEVDWLEVLKPTELAQFKAHRHMDPHVGTLTLFPGISTETLKAFLRAPLRGVVLQTFGAGNAPSNRPELLQVFSEAVASGIIVVNCSQCMKGTVSDLYATGIALRRAGVIPGHDMTTEAALAKLSFLIGHQPPLSFDQIQAALLESIRGELTLPVTHYFSAGSESTGCSVLSALIKAFPQKTTSDCVAFDTILRPSLMSLAASRGDLTALSTFMPHPSSDSNKRIPTFSGHDYSGLTPLHAAVALGKLEAVEWLLRHGACLHQKDAQGRTPLELALLQINENSHDTLRSIIDLLTRTGASLCCSSKTLLLVATQAIINGDFNCLLLLQSLAVNFNGIVDKWDRSLREYLPLWPKDSPVSVDTVEKLLLQ